MPDENEKSEKVSRREAIERAILAGATGAGIVAMNASPAAAQLAVGRKKATNFAAPIGVFSPPQKTVRDFGARGDGVADDTPAAQAAMNAAIKNGGGRVHFPAGDYRITRTLTVRSTDQIDITGDGWSTTLLHENDEPLFLWPESFSCRECSVRNLRVLASGKSKSQSTPVIACLGGTERTFFDHLIFFSDGVSLMGSGIVTRGLADSVALDHCQMWNVTGTGIEIAQGSDVRMVGGRIIGDNTQRKGNIGILLPGGNGGVHVVTPDIIALHTGMQIGGTGGPSNREIIVTHATFDSCVYGVRQFDGSYTSIAGCWAASCDEAQIQVEASASAGALLSINGGTIFNGGATGRAGSKHGLVMRAGNLTMSGVSVRHNAGAGVLVEGANVGDCAISGCRIFNNGTGAILRGGMRAVTGNVFRGNKTHVVEPNRGDNIFAGNLLKT